MAIACVGRLKEEYWRAAAQEYEKRLSRFGKIEILEVEDERAPESLSPAERKKVMEKEGEKLLSRLMPRDHVIALTIEGKAYSSCGFAEFLEKLSHEGYTRIVFLIGGSLGLSEACVKRSDHQLSLSTMTMPHQLARVVLLEQVYRANKIQNNETYHK
ncbi:23S rRNA (pseudouridine(1915)-N(3))-methyltransferase RlmH [Christensenellaceae bacterium OttesenSCG-928-M15]|nr:23S rRNA (pseudouridine(1915)-N(3))-methyltransferase RlmH [Christensenellaceae bacterium OttesenSCG-928-M15]